MKGKVLVRRIGVWLLVLSALGFWARIGVDAFISSLNVHGLEVRLLWSRYDSRRTPNRFGEKMLIGDPKALSIPQNRQTYPGSDQLLPGQEP